MAVAGTPLQVEERDQENMLPSKKTITLQTTLEMTGLAYDKCFERSNTKVLTEVFIK